MSGGIQFRVNSPSVAWDDFEDEVIMVNLETGQYFSTHDTGSEIWLRLAKGTPVSAVEQAMVALYDAEPTAVHEALSGFVAALQQHGLLVPNADAAERQWEAEAPVTEKRAFVAPVLEAHADMQDLLLLDPIHEVDEAGWPTPR